MSKKRDTVGKISSELIHQDDPNHTPIDQMRENLTEYDNNIWTCVENGKKNINGDFYVVVVTKKERLMQNVIRNYFFYVYACPTPTYDQTVYKYHRADNKVDFLWVVPSKDSCEFIRDNALTLPDDQKELIKFVMDFYDDTLLNLAKKLNNEVTDPLELLSKEGIV